MIMKEKLTDSINKLKEFLNANLKPNLLKIDAKVDTLIPNPKIKKIAYIGAGSLFGFMFLIIIIGILVSPFRNKGTQSTGESLKKTIIITSTPEPKKELTESQKEIIKLGEEVKNITFPESVLNLPIIEKDLSI